MFQIYPLIFAMMGKFYLIEFQCIYFGTSGMLSKCSKEYYKKVNDKWIEINNDGIIEEVYATSIVEYIRNKQKANV